MSTSDHMGVMLRAVMSSSYSREVKRQGYRESWPYFHKDIAGSPIFPAIRSTSLLSQTSCLNLCTLFIFLTNADLLVQYSVTLCSVRWLISAVVVNMKKKKKVTLGDHFCFYLRKHVLLNHREGVPCCFFTN